MHEPIVDGLAAVAERSPSAVALTWRSASWSFGELAAASRGAGAALIQAGLASGDRVALLVPNSPHYVASYYGALAAGGVAVPLNTHERAGVLLRQIEHSGARIVIADRANPEWPALRAGLETQDVRVLELTLDDGADSLARFRDELGADRIELAAAVKGPPSAASGLSPDSLATIIYTSGTTGRPKGVMLSHGNVASNAGTIAAYLELDEHDRGLCVLPFHFSYGASVLHSHLLSGAELVIEDNVAYPQRTLQRLQDAAITGFAGVPSTFALLLARCTLTDFDLGRLRYITQAGGPMPRATVERLQAALPGTRIYVMYGQTEATARLCYLPPEDIDRKAGSVGLPIAGVEIDVEREGQSLPRGEIGEICARGPNVMLGYWRDEAASAEVLRDGWLHTGDLGYLDGDGYLYIEGRIVEMIKVGAYRVSPQEVEEAIAALPGVAEVAVTAIGDEILGQAIKAVVVANATDAPDVRSVKAHCRARLAAYKVPKIIEFAATLPRTASGKIQRHKLA